MESALCPFSSDETAHEASQLVAQLVPSLVAQSVMPCNTAW